MWVELFMLEFMTQFEVVRLIWPRFIAWNLENLNCGKQKRGWKQLGDFEAIYI